MEATTMEATAKPSAVSGAAKGILVVEDHDAFRGLVCAALRHQLKNQEVFEAESIASAKQVMLSQSIRVVACDMTLPDGTAMDLLPDLQVHSKEGPRVVIFSNYSEEDLAPLLTRGEIFSFVAKEQGLKALAEAIGRALSP
jgi:DNA-binding NtrC family response regulator